MVLYGAVLLVVAVALGLRAAYLDTHRRIHIRIQVCRPEPVGQPPAGPAPGPPGPPAGPAPVPAPVKVGPGPRDWAPPALSASAQPPHAGHRS